ncbi:S24 family peptidase [Pseudorhodoferax sp. Leaf274]|uniref:XRE family transcriptional regulator n=1 Tax=Pseudorhodoferax sp. Leaf274 TaxID=1736318 RepID=UPI0009E80604|nr:S24 family peptidase [Pseudorhodoferax sp. Leaf274]
MPDSPRLDTLGQRIRHARGVAGLTQMQLAEASGVKQSDISKLERGDSRSTTGLVALARALKVDPNWLDDGDTGPVLSLELKRRIAEIDIKERQARLGLSPVEAIKALPDAALRGIDVVIPQFETGGSMGRGVVLADQPGVIKEWRVSEQWAQQNIHRITSIKNLAIVTGFGPSMQPLFNPGDPLLVDRGVTRADVDGIYFFRVGDEGFVKQLQRIPTVAGLVLRAKSYNTLYDPFDITTGMDFEVFARVVKVWKGEEF